MDEFQDVNFAQVKVLQKLAGEERNVFAVGDPDQAIYRFRGASSAAFVLFQRHFPGPGDQTGEKSPLPVAHSELRICLDFQESECLRRQTWFDAAYQRSVLISAREEDAAREGNQLPRSPVETVVLDAKTPNRAS